MTALEITKAMKSNRKGLLWINDDRREAAYHPNTPSSYCETVDYNDALVAKSDPAFGVVDTTDGTTYAAI